MAVLYCRNGCENAKLKQWGYAQVLKFIYVLIYRFNFGIKCMMNFGPPSTFPGGQL